MNRHARRHGWLILSVVALFVVRAPLCATACAEAQAAGPAPVAHAMPDAPEAPPCHGGGPEVPDEPARSDHECDCDRVTVATAKVDNGSSAPTSWAAPALSPSALASTNRVDGGRRLTSVQRSVPPRDILLRNATLLL